MNRWKKKIAILLTVAMTAGVMAACGSSNETPAQPAAESTPQAAATTAGEENQEKHQPKDASELKIGRASCRERVSSPV